MRISDWSSDVCSSDLVKATPVHGSTTSSVRLPSTSSPPISIRTMSLSLFSGGQGHPIIVIVRLGRRRIVEPFNHARLKPAHKVDRSLFYMAITANLRWQARCLARKLVVRRAEHRNNVAQPRFIFIDQGTLHLQIGRAHV